MVPATAHRECGCPEWTLRCVHFDGVTLRLDEGFNKFHVWEIGPPEKTGGYIFRSHEPSPGYDGLQAAETIFARLERNLIEGDD